MPFVKAVLGTPQEPIRIPQDIYITSIMDELFVNFDKQGYKGDPKDLANFMRKVIKGIDPLKMSIDYIQTITQIMANVCQVFSTIYGFFDSANLLTIAEELQCMNELTRDQGFSREYSHQKHIDQAQWMAALSSNLMKAIYQAAEHQALYPVPLTEDKGLTTFQCTQFIKSTDPRFKKITCGDE